MRSRVIPYLRGAVLGLILAAVFAFILSVPIFKAFIIVYATAWFIGLMEYCL
jgi:hypothetical protein